MRGATDIPRAISCPDCESDVTIVQVAPGLYHGRVAYDDTCPWFHPLKRDLA